MGLSTGIAVNLGYDKAQWMPARSLIARQQM